MLQSILDLVYRIQRDINRNYYEAARQIKFRIIPGLSADCPFLYPQALSSQRHSAIQSPIFPGRGIQTQISHNIRSTFDLAGENSRPDMSCSCSNSKTISSRSTLRRSYAIGKVRRGMILSGTSHPTTVKHQRFERGIYNKLRARFEVNLWPHRQPLVARVHVNIRMLIQKTSSLRR